jgi:DNA-binding response OmpR family regulator
VLVDASRAAAPERVAEHFGTSAPVIAVVKQSTDLLTWWRELEDADAFVYETVDPAELIVRIAKTMNAHERGHVIRAGRVRVDLLRHTVSVAGFSTELTSGEALVLGVLAHASGRWWHAVDLIDELGSVHQTSDTVWQHVHRLRVKLGPWQAVLETSRARGYRLNPCAAPAEKPPPGV